MDWSSAIPAFVVALREGVEASLAVGIVLAYLNRVRQQPLYRWVYVGIGVGVLGSVGVGLMLQSGVQWARAVQPEYVPAIEPLLEGAICTIAIILLSWMLVWMARQAKTVKQETEQAVKSLLQRDRGVAWGIASLAGVAVLREGIELVLFLLAQVEQGWMSLLGSLLGLFGAVAIGFLLFRWGIRIDLGRFFKIMGIFLLLIVAGLVMSALADLDKATLVLDRMGVAGGFCPIPSSSNPEVCWLGPQIWDLSAILPQREFPGMILRSLLGYSDRFYAVQGIAYVAFWGIVGGLYARSLDLREGIEQDLPPDTNREPQKAP